MAPVVVYCPAHITKSAFSEKEKKKKKKKKLTSVY